MSDKPDITKMSKNELARYYYQLDGEYLSLKAEWLRAFEAANRPLADEMKMVRTYMLLIPNK